MVAPLTSKVLGSNGESEGRSILGFCSGAGLGAAGVAGRQGNGGPSLGWAPGDGVFLMEGSLLGAIPDVKSSLVCARLPALLVWLLRWEGKRQRAMRESVSDVRAGRGEVCV